MQLVTIPNSDLTGVTRSPERLRDYCAQLEAGDIIFFPETPIKIPQEDLDFLLGHQHVFGTFHKNIAYRPLEDRITGFEAQDASTAERLRKIMHRYSKDVIDFLGGFLGPYRSQWKVDYASYRPEEEAGRDLALRKRNDLLHTDAFPTRPTHGDRILRFFNNISPAKTRNWMTTDTFDVLVEKMRAGKLNGGTSVPLPSSMSMPNLKRTLAALGLIHLGRDHRSRSTARSSVAAGTTVWNGRPPPGRPAPAGSGRLRAAASDLARRQRPSRLRRCRWPAAAPPGRSPTGTSRARPSDRLPRRTSRPGTAAGRRQVSR